MPTTQYPQRQRCKTCRKGFGNLVIAGEFCSYRCGGFPEPAKNIADAPRGCKREVNGSWGYKTKFKSPSEVPPKYQNDPSTNIYLCDNCRHYHIGHSRPEEAPEKLKRYVSSYEEMSSVIARMMVQKNIDKKVLAKTLKVPTIRITEILNGSPKVSPVLLFNVLSVLRLRVEIAQY